MNNNHGEGVSEIRKGPRESGPDIRAVVAERIRIERARLQLSQEGLAHRSGLSRVHVGTIERGEVSCSLDVLAQIARALGVTPASLLLTKDSGR